MEREIETETVVCQGCESSCEVSVTIENGEISGVEGNNCPTGECYARARALAAATPSAHHQDNKELKPR